MVFSIPVNSFGRKDLKKALSVFDLTEKTFLSSFKWNEKKNSDSPLVKWITSQSRIDH